MKNELVLLNFTGGILPEGVTRRTLFVRKEIDLNEAKQESLERKIDPVAIIRKLEANTTSNKNM